ncbi:hypothetical protein [Maize bushy stunt phytoplasma]|uniref:hypothetical protein n=1 Tax=Maize bushy stunt phytoplasma TaxID=202462 RepID=UPI001E2E0E9C|nr:hypothetical protein [Maize bushy stunt phytoplasma]
MKTRDNELTTKTIEYEKLNDMITDQKTWKGSFQPIRTNINDKIIKPVTSWFRKWF